MQPPSPDTALSLGTTFLGVAQRRAQEVAVFFEGHAIPYGDLARQTEAFATALRLRGIQPGDRVAIILPNFPHFLPAYFGTMRAGAIAITMNPTYRPPEIRHIFTDAQVAAAVVWSDALPLVEQAMCFAARNGLVAFNVSYRLAPAAMWPTGAKDVSAAISWVHENADLFGGNKQEIIPIGYGTGAFHLASFLAHKEFQERDDYVAGAVLVSGIYHPTDVGEGERAYFGTDTSTYDSRSAIPGLTAIEEPILLAWSSADAPTFIAQGEKLRQQLCNAGHCPRTAILTKRGSPASVFDLDGESGNLHDRLRQLIGQIDARGLP